MRVLVRGAFLILFIVVAIAIGGVFAYRIDPYKPDYAADARTQNRVAELIRSQINELVGDPIESTDPNEDGIFFQTKGEDVRACRITDPETLEVECGEWDRASE